MSRRALQLMSLGLLAVAACFSPEVDDESREGCSGNDACNGDRVCVDRQCVMPGDEESSDEESPSDGDYTAGDQCLDEGDSCEQNGECCEFGDSSAGCVDFTTSTECAQKCESNDECASGCCMPLLSNDQPLAYGACAAAETCVATPCGAASCEIEWCTPPFENNCPISYFGDGQCDCGCQFVDVDCS